MRSAQIMPDGVTYPPYGERMNVIDWLLDSDPAIRGQVMRDLTDAPVEDVAAERAKVATAGWGAQLLALQPSDGLAQPRWLSLGFPNGWHYDPLRALHYLRDAGVEPDERMAEAIAEYPATV